MTTTDAPTQQPQPEPCQTCQGNGEVVTDWERYLHPKPGDAGDEAVADCPDCDGQGLQDAQPQPSDAAMVGAPVCPFSAVAVSVSKLKHAAKEARRKARQ